MSKQDVLVVGAGVVGLTTAVRLAEDGFAVRVLTSEPPLRTTSAAAGAIWGPHFAEHDRLGSWGQETLRVLEGLATESGTGVREVSGLDVARSVAQPPKWAVGLRNFRRCPSADLPVGFLSGWSYTAPVVDMPAYLQYLAERLTNAGGKIELGVVSSEAELVLRASIAVNCTGSGASELVGDETVVPIRGQLVVVDNPGIERFLDEDTESPELTYILPQGEHVILGGSAEVGRTDLSPDPKIAAGILARCIALEPRLRGARVREHRVGLRPSRPQVRLEHEKIDGCHLIHNYGHGGAGVTLSWGCAHEVLSLIKELR